jgi:hypothetical protein
MTSLYKKSFKVAKPSKDKDNQGMGYKVKGGVNKYKFKKSHPGYKFSHLTELKHPTIPKISLPRDKLCPIRIPKIKKASPALGDKEHDKRGTFAGDLSRLDTRKQGRFTRPSKASTR